MNSLIELKRFYLYKNKLLHATEYFIGFNPIISLPLQMPIISVNGEMTKKQNFILGEELFTAKLTSTPAKRYESGSKKIEVFQNNKRLIRIEKGTYGFGTNYSTGKNFYVNGDKAYLLTKGIWLKAFEEYMNLGAIDGHSYYLLCFSDITIPTEYPLRKLKSKVNTIFPISKKHVASKIKLWDGALQTNEGAFQVTCTTILAVEAALPQISKPRGTIEFTLEGEPLYFENF